MALEHSPSVAEARKVLAERPAEVDRDEMRLQIAYRIAETNGPSEHRSTCPVWPGRASVARCDCWILRDAKASSDAVLDVVWPLIESQQAFIASGHAALRAVLAELDWLAAAHEATANSLTAVRKAYQEQLERADRLEMSLIQHAEVTDKATAARDEARTGLAEAQQAAEMAIAKYSAAKERSEQLAAELANVRTYCEGALSYCSANRVDPPPWVAAILDSIDCLAQPPAGKEEDPNSSGGTP